MKKPEEINICVLQNGDGSMFCTTTLSENKEQEQELQDEEPAVLDFVSFSPRHEGKQEVIRLFNSLREISNRGDAHATDSSFEEVLNDLLDETFKLGRKYPLSTSVQS